MSDAHSVTQLLEQWNHGDREALDKLMPLIFEQLRKMASVRMTPQQYERLTELFHAVLETAAEDRSAYLNQVSDGDAELRRELESLSLQCVCREIDTALEGCNRIIGRRRAVAVIGRPDVSQHQALDQ